MAFSGDLLLLADDDELYPSIALHASNIKIKDYGCLNYSFASRAAAGLCVATLAADVCGALLTGLGLRSADHRTKFRYYRFAVLAMALARMYSSYLSLTQHNNINK